MCADDDDDIRLATDFSWWWFTVNGRSCYCFIEAKEIKINKQLVVQTTWLAYS